MSRGRGGYRKPNKPAPASGPGALSQRTDGGPADRQPMRLGPAEQHGARQGMVNLQGAAPMAAGGPPGAGGPSVGMPAPPDLFAPDTGGGPITAGARGGAGPGPAQPVFPEDPDEIIRIAYQMTGHPDLLEMIEGEF
jgi:hypothetical protein